MSGQFSRRFSSAAASLLGTLLAGCAGSMVSTGSSPAVINVSGNWQFSSKAASAAGLPAVSGSLSGTNTSIHGVLHSDSISACIAPSAAFAVSGSADAGNKVILTGSVAGGTFTLTGILAADGKSVSNATYNVSGGACAFSTRAAVSMVQVYAPISGTYKGNFIDQYGDPNPVSVTLTQTSNADANGNFTMDGTGTFPANACFNSPATTSGAQVSGDSFNVTYTDPNSQESITVGGTFASDASTLSLTAFQISGPCGNYNFNITGTLTKQ